MPRTKAEINNEVLARLWNDKHVRELNRDVDDICRGTYPRKKWWWITTI